MEKIIVTARIEGQTHRDLMTIAKRDDRSLSYLLRNAVEQYVARAQIPASTRSGRRGR